MDRWPALGSPPGAAVRLMDSEDEKRGITACSLMGSEVGGSWPFACMTAACTNANLWLFTGLGKPQEKKWMQPFPLLSCIPKHRSTSILLPPSTNKCELYTRGVLEFLRATVSLMHNLSIVIYLRGPANTVTFFVWGCFSHLCDISGPLSVIETSYFVKIPLN